MARPRCNYETNGPSIPWSYPVKINKTRKITYGKGSHTPGTGRTHSVGSKPYSITAVTDLRWDTAELAVCFAVNGKANGERCLPVFPRCRCPTSRVSDLYCFATTSRTPTHPPTSTPLHSLTSSSTRLDVVVRNTWCAPPPPPLLRMCLLCVQPTGNAMSHVSHGAHQQQQASVSCRHTYLGACSPPPYTRRLGYRQTPVLAHAPHTWFILCCFHSSSCCPCLATHVNTHCIPPYIYLQTCLACLLNA